MSTMKMMFIIFVCSGLLKASTTSSLMTILISLELIVLGIFMSMVYSWMGVVVQAPVLLISLCVIESVIGLVIYVNLVRKGGTTSLSCLGI